MNMKQDSNLIEGVKLLYDYMKHLTTLSVGSIVVLATFLGSASSTARSKGLAITALVCFVICIVGNVVAACIYAMKAEYGDFSYIKGTRQNIAAPAFFISILAFVIAMISLAAFAITNYA